MHAILPVPGPGASVQRDSGILRTQDLRLGPRACLRQVGYLRILASDLVLVYMNLFFRPGPKKRFWRPGRETLAILVAWRACWARVGCIITGIQVKADSGSHVSRSQY